MPISLPHLQCHLLTACLHKEMSWKKIVSAYLLPFPFSQKLISLDCTKAVLQVLKFRILKKKISFYRKYLFVALTHLITLSFWR